MQKRGGTPVISSDEAMQLYGQPNMHIVTGPLGICVYADLEPELDCRFIGYLSDDAVREWLEKGWLQFEDWSSDGAMAVTPLAYSEAQRRRTGHLPPLSLL